MYIYPDYYKDFHCIASACRHNCCIGWEIDIDADTVAYYATVPGEMGARLARCISADGEPHFILDGEERCPFLNPAGLCDIILQLGEDRLCAICADHPRFRNELPDRTEVGIGMACEEAARLILTKKTPSVPVGNTATADAILLLRDRMTALLQDREKPIAARVSGMLAAANARLPDRSLSAWAEVLLGLERLDDAWTRLLLRLRDTEPDLAAFDAHMRGRETEYEQLLVYLLYRHFACAPDLGAAADRAALVALLYRVLHALGALQFAAVGDFTVADQIELCRMFSAEIEYSDENIYLLLDAIAP